MSEGFVMLSSPPVAGPRPWDGPSIDTARWHEVEDRVIVISASTICPSPDTCDLQDTETYEEYVTRHMAEHNLPEANPKTGAPWTMAERERNLGLWCLYYFHKWIQGNMSLLPYPCWEDADFLANGTFSDVDLEVGVPREERTYKLKPYAERVVDFVQYKRMRKLTKVRETQKSSWCKAFITWRHLRAYFVERNIYFRVMVVSAFSALARDSYLEVFKVMWAQHGKIVDLFGTVERTRRWRENGADRDSEERQLGLLDWKKSKLKDGLQLRWNVASKVNTGQSVTSLFVAGATTATAGRRWDLIVVDDACIPENSGTEAQRQKVKTKQAELRKELSAVGELVWLNTPHAMGDASQEIDEKYQDEFHILLRPGRWGHDGYYSYYWERDGICAVKQNNIECGRPRHEHQSCHVHGEITEHPFFGRVVWDRDRIERESRQMDFYSQILLLVRDARHALFHESYFQIVPVQAAPEEIRFGLGRPLTEDEREALDMLGREHGGRRGREIRAYNQIDTAGKAVQTKTGCRSAIIGVRFDAIGNIWITHIQYGYWSASQECDAMWASIIRNQPDQFEYEVSGAHEKYARAAHSDFYARKSQEHGGAPLLWPVMYVNPSETNQDGQNRRIEKCEPYAQTGRIKILADAGSPDDIRSFVQEFCDFPWAERRDGPDAFSRVLKRMEAVQFEERPKDAEVPGAGMYLEPDGGSFVIEGWMHQKLIDELDGPAQSREWGKQGRRESTNTRPEIEDSIPAGPEPRRNRRVA